MSRLISVILLMLSLTGCAADEPDAGTVYATEHSGSDVQTVSSETVPSKEPDEKSDTMKLFIDGKDVPVIWEDNDAVKELQKLADGSPLTIVMSEYGGFEQVGPIGTSLPADNSRITTECCDIVLYSSDQIVIFYGSNSWDYTRLGRIDMSDREIKELLSKDNVTVTIS